MRFHPALYQNYRVAVNDDVIPLSKPIVNKMGQEVQELQIPKSIKIIASIAAYNRYMTRFASVSVYSTCIYSGTKRYLEKTQTYGTQIGG